MKDKLEKIPSDSQVSCENTRELECQTTCQKIRQNGSEWQVKKKYEKNKMPDTYIDRQTQFHIEYQVTSQNI